MNNAIIITYSGKKLTDSAMEKVIFALRESINIDTINAIVLNEKEIANALMKAASPVIKIDNQKNYIRDSAAIYIGKRYEYYIKQTDKTEFILKLGNDLAVAKFTGKDTVLINAVEIISKSSEEISKDTIIKYGITQDVIHIIKEIAKAYV